MNKFEIAITAALLLQVAIGHGQENGLLRAKFQLMDQACALAAKAARGQWLEKANQAIADGNVQLAKYYGCKIVREGDKACMNAKRAVIELPPLTGQEPPSEKVWNGYYVGGLPPDCV